MRSVVHYALACYPKKDVMKTLIQHAMAQDFSFERSAKEYILLYCSMLDALPGKDLSNKKKQKGRNWHDSLSLADLSRVYK